MDRIFSGMQPTSSTVHIGNYLGAIANWIRLSEDHDCIYCVVDYHALTIKDDPEERRARSREFARQWIAAGLDPEKCTIFVQSRVPEHTELAWILSCVTPLGEVERMTQFKDKAQQHRQNVNLGLLSYPVLQAADILLYKATKVPVGEDQVQHLELSREVARKFNTTFQETFPEPAVLLTQAARVMGLDGEHKMSKSRGNHIALLEEPEVIWEKLKPAKTDPARQRRKDPGTPEKCNIYTLHQSFSSPEQIAEVAEGCRTAGIGCFDCKKVLADNLAERFAPVRERAADLVNRPEELDEILDQGAKRARGIARETLLEVRERTGLTPAPME